MLAHAAYFSTDSGIRASEGASFRSYEDNTERDGVHKAVADGKAKETQAE